MICCKDLEFLIEFGCAKVSFEEYGTNDIHFAFTSFDNKNRYDTLAMYCPFCGNPPNYKERVLEQAMQTIGEGCKEHGKVHFCSVPYEPFIKTSDTD